MKGIWGCASLEGTWALGGMEWTMSSAGILYRLEDESYYAESPGSGRRTRRQRGPYGADVRVQQEEAVHDGRNSRTRNGTCSA